MITEYALELSSDNRHPLLVQERNHFYDNGSLDHPEKIQEMFRECYSLHLKAEEFVYALMMDHVMHPLGLFEIGHGTVNLCYLGAREVFIRALLCGAVYMVIVHNHPGGSKEPSFEDQQVCRNLQEAGDLLGIRLKDFMIISISGYYSFMEEGYL